ncbi:MAG: hypothetical protein ACMXX8_01650, partial [Candidatus Woesearchaeota archaeon]
MKKTIYLFIFVLMLPLVISNSVKINWDVEDLDLNYYDGFFIFYSYENNYIPPETANKKSCEKNPNCVFIDIIDTNQKSYYYILDNLKNERYVYFLYPSNKYNNFLSMPLYLGNSVHYQLPSINLPAKIYWKLSEESPIEDIDGFFIFLSEKKIYRPSIYTDKKTCLSSDFCIFVEKEEPFQTFFSYKVFAPFLSNYYLHIHPSIINSPLIGRPLIYNVYEEKTIENKIDKGYEIFFNQNELNFKIGL